MVVGEKQKIMSIEEVIQKVVQHPKFVQLKSILENNPYHDQEDVYTHSLKTMDVAGKNIDGSFISDPEAKGLFLKYVNEDLGGLKRKDLMILIALLHDIGKADVDMIQTEDGTRLLGHEQKGSEAVGLIIKDFGFSSEQLDLIKKVIRLHDKYNAKNLSEGLSIEQIKKMGEGAHIEILFNRYCDCFYAKPFQPYLEVIRNIFTSKDLYN